MNFEHRNLRYYHPVLKTKRYCHYRITKLKSFPGIKKDEFTTLKHNIHYY